MSTALSLPASPTGARAGYGLMGVMFVVAILAAILAGWLPIEFSIATVFLFAGPHNWFETRYILSRLPARTGKLWVFFTLSFAGIVGLTASFAAMPALLRAFPQIPYESGYATWNTLFMLWLATLVHMRANTNPRRDWFWFWPLTFALIAVSWLEPFWFSLGLVYLHPLMALWILDREIAHNYSTWRKAYRTCLLALPVFLGLLIWRLHDAPDLPGDDGLTLAITNHAGDWIMPNVSNRLLVALHTFLEMVHYAVWVLLIPLLGYRFRLWDLRSIPAARRNANWTRGVALLLLAGAFIVLLLWTCFLLDYGTTRHIYFVVAMLHVLAEIPFLLRLL